MKNKRNYPIGTLGKPWGNDERLAWRAQTTIHREYQHEVVSKINALRNRFIIEQYGALSYDPERYPLYCVKSKNWDREKPTVLITGGVHGYETSGVHGAIQFMNTQAEQYQTYFNVIAAPCVSPWGYETINRWNPNAVDPNRSFYPDSPAEESANLMKLVSTLKDVLVHFDLHETTDTDGSEFRPALAARDGIHCAGINIPDGFYTVCNAENPQEEFQSAIIKSVSKVTHIAPEDDKGNICSTPIIQQGVISYPMVKLGLCGGITSCSYGTTTEVYPDSPKASDEVCNRAQVAAIIGGLDYVTHHL